MKLIHVVSHIDQEASGPGYSVPMLCDALARRGHNVRLATLARDNVRTLPTFQHDSYEPSFGPLRLGVSREMQRGLAQSVRSADLIHSHGLWMMPNLYPAWAARSAGKPLVVSPRGMLSPVARARSRWLKRAFWATLQERATRGAHMLHATSDQEYRDIRRFGLTQPGVVVPNGIDLPEIPTPSAAPADVRRLLYLGRIHPIKGLEILIESWTSLADRFPGWELMLVGPGDEAYVASLKRLCARLRAPRVAFEGPRYGAAKSEAYRAADLYVLPSFSENFGMSVAEALAHGVPVVTSTGMPWAGVISEGCGWRVEPSVEGVGSALSDALAGSRQDLSQMGARGRAWMGRDFSWDQIARQMEAAYEWLLSGGLPPANVHLD